MPFDVSSREGQTLAKGVKVLAPSMGRTTLAGYVTFASVDEVLSKEKNREHLELCRLHGSWLKTSVLKLK